MGWGISQPEADLGSQSRREGAAASPRFALGEDGLDAIRLTLVLTPPTLGAFRLPGGSASVRPEHG